MRPIQATIYLSALRHNLAKVKATAPHSKVMAVVKANAYGHGLLNAAQGLAKAHGFAALRLEEGLLLRESGYRQEILLLEGIFEPEELPMAAEAGLSLVVHCNEQIDILEKARLSRPVAVFAKMNTGMNRLGFTAEAYATAVKRLEECGNVSGITMMTHFATADEDVGIAEPAARFTTATEGLEYPISLANSAAILRYPESHHDWVRPGIMLYGATPVQGTPASAFGLKPAMSLKSRLIAIQELRPGEGVGYGQKFTAHERTRVGVVACGYADGYPRHAPSGTAIAVAGQLTQTVGRVSMDMLFADITHIPDAAIGSEVELWGTQVPVDAVAEAAGTVGYELLCAVAPRVPMAVAD